MLRRVVADAAAVLVAASVVLPWWAPVGDPFVPGAGPERLSGVGTGLALLFAVAVVRFNHPPPDTPRHRAAAWMLGAGLLALAPTGWLFGAVVTDPTRHPEVGLVLALLGQLLVGGAALLDVRRVRVA